MRAFCRSLVVFDCSATNSMLQARRAGRSGRGRPGQWAQGSGQGAASACACSGAAAQAVQAAQRQLCRSARPSAQRARLLHASLPASRQGKRARRPAHPPSRPAAHPPGHILLLHCVGQVARDLYQLRRRGRQGRAERGVSQACHPAAQPAAPAPVALLTAARPHAAHCGAVRCGVVWPAPRACAARWSPGLRAPVLCTPAACAPSGTRPPQCAPGACCTAAMRGAAAPGGGAGRGGAGRSTRAGGVLRMHVCLASRCQPAMAACRGPDPTAVPPAAHQYDAAGLAHLRQHVGRNLAPQRQARRVFGQRGVREEANIRWAKLANVPPHLRLRGARASGVGVGVPAACAGRRIPPHGTAPASSIQGSCTPPVLQCPAACTLHRPPAARTCTMRSCTAVTSATLASSKPAASAAWYDTDSSACHWR